MAIDVCERLFASGTQRRAFGLGRRLDRGGGGADGAQALRKLVVKLARQMAPLLLLSVDQPGGKRRSFARRPVEACRERVEDLADALKLDEAEARQPA